MDGNIQTIGTELPKRVSHEKDLQAAITVAMANLSMNKDGLIKTHQLKDEDSQVMKQQPQVKPVATSTIKELSNLVDAMVPVLNTSACIENTNTSAKASIVIDSTVIMEDVPVTVLMPLKKQLAKLLPVLSSIKVLDRATQWVEATGQDFPKVYVTTNPVTTDHTITSKRWQEISPATPQFQAQLKEVQSIEIVGQYTTTTFSGNMHQTEKTELIRRLTTLITAIESAIQLANSKTELKRFYLGNELMRHVFGDLLDY